MSWDALAEAGRGDRHHLRDLLARLPPDPWGPLDAVDQRLDEGVLRRLGA